jgi:hypothetical protein
LYKLPVDNSKSKCCRECVKCSLKYDVEGPSVSDWASLEHAEDGVSCKLAQTTSELYEMLARQSCLMKQQGFLKTQAKEILRCGLDSLDELKAQEKKEKTKRDKEEVASTTIHLTATAAVQPSNFPSEELLTFESSFWELMAGGDEIPPVSQGN